MSLGNCTECNEAILADTEDWKHPMCHTCFCKVDWYSENKKLHSQLREAEEVISFYAGEEHWFNGGFGHSERGRYEHIDDDIDVEKKVGKNKKEYTIGGLLAREYQSKYMENRG